MLVIAVSLLVRLLGVVATRAAVGRLAAEATECGPHVYWALGLGAAPPRLADRLPVPAGTDPDRPARAGVLRRVDLIGCCQPDRNDPDRGIGPPGEGGGGDRPSRPLAGLGHCIAGYAFKAAIG